MAYPEFAVTSLFFEFPIDWVNLWFAVPAMLLLSFVLLAIALWGSVGLPGRGAATIATVVVAYVVNALGSVVSDIEVLRKLAPSTGPTAHTFWSTACSPGEHRSRLPSPWRSSLPAGPLLSGARTG